MPSISFQPVLRDVRDVLKSDFYSIPRFQRPYSWSSENLDDFWRDVLLDNTAGYFIGPMVSYGTGSDAYGIVDGQQRITTITLALCVIRDKFQSMQAHTLAKGLDKYIERDDDDSITHYVLKSEAAKDFLTSQIQARLPRGHKDAKTDEERSLRKAHGDIERWISDLIVDKSESHKEGPENSDAANALKDIRDKILSLQVIWIVLDTEDDAYVVFETLNSRGKDLETVDLLKNLLLGAIKAENGDLDTARMRWTTMRTMLSDAGSGANPNKFILHWWLARHEYTAERKLYRLMKNQLVKKDAAAWLESLEDDSETYARIANPAGWSCKQHEMRLRQSLIALNAFNVRQPRPFLLALLRALEDDVIKYKSVRRAVRAIEAYHYVSTAIVGVSSTGGVSMMYASRARELSSATNTNEASKVIDGLIGKLKSGISPRDTFISEFPRALHYSAEKPEAKRLVQYTLRELHEYFVPGTALDHTRCNIEHISPQAAGTTWMHQVGNLLWIDEKLNTQLGSKSFDEKKMILETKSQSYDVDDIIGSSHWGEEEVAKRATRLATAAYDHVWRIT